MNYIDGLANVLSYSFFIDNRNIIIDSDQHLSILYYSKGQGSIEFEKLE